VSDHWLKYVPADPLFRPTSSAAAAAKLLLRAFLPDADVVEARFLGHVTFIDPGSNWSGVHCPACGTDAQGWWAGAIASAYRAGFACLDTRAPCCDAAVSLNELRYVFPAAFGSFVLEARNPGAKRLSSGRITLLGATLGCAVREIPVRL
jgi:hypothetical protein